MNPIFDSFQRTSVCSANGQIVRPCDTLDFALLASIPTSIDHAKLVVPFYRGLTDTFRDICTAQQRRRPNSDTRCEGREQHDTKIALLPSAPTTSPLQLLQSVVIDATGTKSAPSSLSAEVISSENGVTLLAALCELSTLNKLQRSVVAPLWSALQDLVTGANHNSDSPSPRHTLQDGWAQLAHLSTSSDPCPAQLLSAATGSFHTRGVERVALFLQDALVDMLLRHSVSLSSIPWQELGAVLRQYEVPLLFPMSWSNVYNRSQKCVASSTVGCPRSREWMVIRSVGRDWLLQIQNDSMWRKLTGSLQLRPQSQMLMVPPPSVETAALTQLVKRFTDLSQLLVQQEAASGGFLYPASLLAFSRDIDFAFRVALSQLERQINNTPSTESTGTTAVELLRRLRDRWRYWVAPIGLARFLNASLTLPRPSTESEQWKEVAVQLLAWPEVEKSTSRKRNRDEEKTEATVKEHLPTFYARGEQVLRTVSLIDPQNKFQFPSLNTKALLSYCGSSGRLPSCTYLMAQQLRHVCSRSGATEKDVFQFLRQELDALVDEQVQLHGPDHPDSALALAMRQELVRASQQHHLKML